MCLSFTMGTTVKDSLMVRMTVVPPKDWGKLNAVKFYFTFNPLRESGHEAIRAHLGMRIKQGRMPVL